MTDKEFMDALEQGEGHIPEAKVFISRAEYDKLVAQGALIAKLREALESLLAVPMGYEEWAVKCIGDNNAIIAEALALTPAEAAAQIRREVLEEAAKKLDDIELSGKYKRKNCDFDDGYDTATCELRGLAGDPQ